MENLVMADGGRAIVTNPTAGVSIAMQFLPPFILTCAAIPIAFMIVRDPWHAITVLIMAIGGAGVTMLVIYYRLHATFAWYDQHGHHAMVPLEQLHLEVVPWVSFGILVLGMTIQRLSHKELGPHPDRHTAPSRPEKKPIAAAK